MTARTPTTAVVTLGSVGATESVASIGLPDEVAFELPEVIVELARIRPAEPLAQRGKRDGVGVLKRFVCLPERQQD